MPRHRRTPVPLLLALVLAAGCGEDPQMHPTPTSPGARHLGVASISGRVLGPDGTSICNFLVPSATYIVRAISYPNPGAIVATQTLTCPLDGYDLPTDSGSFALRVQGLGPLTLAPLPDRVINLGPIVVSATADTAVDLPVDNGVVLGGGATLDGTPAGGTGVTASYAAFSAFGAGFGISDPGGGWRETFGRSPTLLQGNVDYTFSLCGVLTGTRLIDSIPPGPVHFPVPVGSVACSALTSRAARFTHASSGLVVGALPGDIGGLSPASGDLGTGYGVQFSTPAQPPQHVGVDVPPAQLFIGGLLLGASSTQILSGVNLAGYTPCSPSPCRDLGPGARGQVFSTPQGNHIVWRYDDKRSTRSLGLGVVQESFDGPPGSDYTLFRFRITNQRSAPVALHPGLFMDGDVNGNPAFNAGFSALNSQLTYVSDIDGSGNPVGPAMGTMVFAANQPSPGPYIFTVQTAQISLARIFDALTGALQQPTFGPADVQYIQGGAGISIPAHKFRDVWVAVVAGADVSSLLVNAQAAAVAVGATQGAALPSGGGSSISVPLGRAVAQPPRTGKARLTPQ